VKALKMLFLYTQGNKLSVDEYFRNFKSLWDMVEAFRGSPRVHKGLVDVVLKTKAVYPNNPSKKELREVEAVMSEAVKAALLISGANKTRYGQLKEQLANSYLLRTDQYPNTLEKTSRILRNY
jgi:hypothetical protein